MYLLLNHNIIHDDHTHNLFHDQNHLHPAIVVDKQNGGKTAQKAEKGDAVFDYLIILKSDADNDQNFKGLNAVFDNHQNCYVNGHLGLGKASKKTFFLGDLSQMCLSTHPRVFVRFGKMKGEIRVEKGDFRGYLVFF